jgi:uncharacterized membrane protein HdeD (DUF308 family)
MENIRDAASSWGHETQKNAGWLLVLGVVTVLAGFLSVGSPVVGGLGMVFIIGIAMTIGGVARAIGAFSAGSFGSGALAFVGGILTFGAGLMVVTQPGIGLATLTLILGAYLVVDGISSAVLAFQVRPETGWGWMLFSAAIGVVVGILLLSEWPLSGLWAVGTLVGIHLIFAGFSLISVGLAARRLGRLLAA